MMPLNGENPSLSTLNWYEPKGRLRAVRNPASSVTRRRLELRSIAREGDRGLHSEAARVGDFEAKFS
jgi:hypothetical protein